MTKDCVILDVDGTIADNQHRLHLIKGKNKNYDKFFALSDKDPPIEDVIWLVNKMSRGEGFVIFVCSGRSDEYRELTEEWLENHIDFYIKELFMRKAGDYRQDYIIKEEFLREIESRGYRVRAAIDDRPQVIDMWKKNGITVFKVGDWEREELNVEPGILHMMVGPSGAGKSEMILDLFPDYFNSAIISSDNLREELTGDFRDMSKDTIMWDMLHKLVETRLHHGANTVVDATNLKNQNRKSLRDLQLPNGKIVYHVYNRPVKDKIESGGWRNEVNVKGKTLIEYHENVFQSNLAAILAGDGDERVEVKDYR